MLKRLLPAAISLSVVVWSTGCGVDTLLSGANGNGAGAAIVGSISSVSSTAKALAWSGSGACPDVAVTLNGNPADIIFDDDCSFLIENVAPSESVDLRVEIPSLGIAGSVELSSVTDAELIELAVAVGEDSLSVSVERRAKPTPGDELPTTVDDNNVTIELPAGTYSQDLTVHGNNFTLTGAAGDTCDADGWTTLDGTVVITGNNAKFRNVKFAGSVEVRANNPKFINCCFDGVLVSFGKGHGHDENDDDDDEGEDGEDHDSHSDGSDGKD